MAHGGKRAGAGRKPGGKNQKTREIADRAVAEGITPLEVMLRVMRDHFEEERFDQAASVAKDAAPYCHPRLASIEHSGKGGGPILTKELPDDELAAIILRGRGGANGTPQSANGA